MGTRISEVLNASPSDWNDWRWQMRQKPVCSDLEQLATLGLVASDAKQQGRRVGLTPYNVKLLLALRDADLEGYRAETLQSFLLSTSGSKQHQWVWAKRHDLFGSRLMSHLPISAFIRTLFTGKGADTKTRAMEKMYPKTDVIIATATCARHCSFCFREVGDAQGEASLMTGNMETLMDAVGQVIAHKVPHVLVTGGDPLTRSNQQLKQMLSPLAESETVEVLRLATRMIVDLPMRFYDQELLAVLSDLAQTMKRRHASFRIVTHVNHACELTLEAVKAIENIQACGIEVMNQTVVLKGVNDNAETLQKLLMELDRLGVRNHKLFHTMPVMGTERLRIPIRKFRQLVATLHQWVPGTSVPQATVATSVGKIPVPPSGRWIVPIPFSNRLLCRSFKKEWYLFKDVWDFGRHLKEAAVAFAVALLLMVVFLPRHSTSVTKLQQQRQPQTIERVAYLADEIGYPDYWARQYFPPYVVDGVLYLPLQELRFAKR